MAKGLLSSWRRTAIRIWTRGSSRSAKRTASTCTPVGCPTKARDAETFYLSRRWGSRPLEPEDRGDPDTRSASQREAAAANAKLSEYRLAAAIDASQTGVTLSLSSATLPKNIQSVLGTHTFDVLVTRRIFENAPL